MGDILSTANANLNDLASSISIPTSYFNLSSTLPTTLPSLSAPSSQNSWHILLWDTDCLFCTVFQPVSSWTVVGRLARKHRQGRAGGRRKKRGQMNPQNKHSKKYRLKTIRRHNRRMYPTRRSHQSHFLPTRYNTFHSLPTFDEKSRGGYKTYYYENPIPRPEEEEVNSQVQAQKRNMEENQVINVKVVKSALKVVKSVLEIGLKILEIWKLSIRTRIQSKEKENS